MRRIRVRRGAAGERRFGNVRRRDFLKITGAAGIATTAPFTSWGARARAVRLTNQLSDPARQPKFVSLAPNALDPGFKYTVAANGEFTVGVGPTLHDAGLLNHGGRPVLTPVWGYGQDGAYTWPGKTFEVQSGPDTTVVNWENNLFGVTQHLLPLDESLHWAYSLPGYEEYTIAETGVPIVVHLHGGRSDFQFDGNPEFFFNPGASVVGPQWNNVPGGFTNRFVYDNDVPAGNLWYHDHALGITRLNVYAGMAGLYFVRDEMDTGQPNNPLNLPAFPYELAYAIQDRMFKRGGELFYPSRPGDPFWEDFITGEGLGNGREFELDAFIGVAIYPDHAVDDDDLYQKASSALVAAELSEWPIEYFHENEDNTDTSAFTIIQSLRRAIERDELKLVYQPVVDLQSYQTIYLEALLRWKDPEGHDISIEQTIRLAEQNHLIKSLTNWIIQTACRFVSQSELGDVAVGINLSMIDLHDRRLPERIQTYLNKYKVRPEQIVIEITEGQIMQEPEKVVEVLAHLGVMGLSLSIDDFGTGQASLTYLKELPVEKLKIDQSFVRDIATNPDDQLIVRATIELAHTLDLKVVAEGVETLAVCEMLAEMNCDHVQGYYISRPLEAEQVGGWFETLVKPDLVRKGR